MLLWEGIITHTQPECGWAPIRLALTDLVSCHVRSASFYRLLLILPAKCDPVDEGRHGRLVVLSSHFSTRVPRKE